MRIDSNFEDLRLNTSKNYKLEVKYRKFRNASTLSKPFTLFESELPASKQSYSFEAY